VLLVAWLSDHEPSAWLSSHDAVPLSLTALTELPVIALPPSTLVLTSVLAVAVLSLNDWSSCVSWLLLVALSLPVSL
jgi:hypothetical protein